jgi:hypothetical protein
MPNMVEIGSKVWNFIENKQTNRYTFLFIYTDITDLERTAVGDENTELAQMTSISKQ